MLELHIFTSFALLSCLTAFLLYWSNRKRIQLLKRCGIPGPTPVPLLGNLLHLKEGLFQTERIWIQQYGDVLGWYFGPKLQVVISSKELLQEVLVKKFSNFSNRWFLDVVPSPLDLAVSFVRDNDWKRIRTVILPTLKDSNVRSMEEKIRKCATGLSLLLDRKADTDDTINVYEQVIQETCLRGQKQGYAFGFNEIKNVFKTFSWVINGTHKKCVGAYTLSTISYCAFGLDIDAISNPEDPMILRFREIFTRSNTLKFLAIATVFPNTAPIFKQLDLSPFPKRTIEYIVQKTREIINDRRKNSKVEPDFLQVIMDAEIYKHDITDKKGLTYDEVNGQAFAFFLGGYETNASLLQYLFYTFAHHPEIQAKVQEEIEDQLGDEEPDFYNLRKLEYMDMVISETLRMYPPLARMNREAADTVQVCGVQIPQGAAVVIPIYDIHHNPKFYPDPERFYPERFSHENKPSIDPSTYLAFGGGPRGCIGKKFAIMSTKMALVYILRKVLVMKCSETEELPLKFKTDTPLLHTVSPIKVKVHRINKDD